MKKAVKIITSVLVVILAAIIAFCGYLAFRIYANAPKTQNGYNEIYLQNEITLDVDSDGKFRVLKINDTHFFNGTCDNDVRTLDELKTVLDKTPCNLIIANGDLVDGFNLNKEYDKYQAISEFAGLVKSYDIPWTFAPGNNDGEIDGDIENVIAYMMQYDHFVCGNDKNTDGAMQFFIDLTDSGELVHSIAILDSGSRTPKITGSYDYIKGSQINWLLDGIEERQVNTSVFFHMPTPQFQKAYNNGEVYNGFMMYNTYPYDDIEKNKLFDEMTANNEYISLISCGHQHSNNMCTFYDERYYQLSSVSGYSASMTSL